MTRRGGTRVALFDLLPHALVLEVLSYLNAVNMAMAATICRCCAEGIAAAIAARLQRGHLRLPEPVHGDCATRRLLTAESVGLTGQRWEICTNDPSYVDGEGTSDVIIRHRTSGLTLILHAKSNGWIGITAPPAPNAAMTMFTDCLKSGLDQME